VALSQQTRYLSVGDQRSFAFERVRRVFRWTTAGAVGAVALIVGVVAHQIPGRSGTPATTTGGPAAAAQPPTGSPTSSGSSSSGSSSTPTGPISPPATLPAPTQRTPTAVSGGTSSR